MGTESCVTGSGRQITPAPITCQQLTKGVIHLRFFEARSVLHAQLPLDLRYEIPLHLFKRPIGVNDDVRHFFQELQITVADFIVEGYFPVVKVVILLAFQERLIAPIGSTDTFFGSNIDEYIEIRQNGQAAYAGPRIRLPIGHWIGHESGMRKMKRRSGRQ